MWHYWYFKINYGSWKSHSLINELRSSPFMNIFISSICRDKDTNKVWNEKAKLDHSNWRQGESNLRLWGGLFKYLFTFKAAAIYGWNGVLKLWIL